MNDARATIGNPDHICFGDGIRASRIGFGTACLADGDLAWGRRSDEPGMVRLLRHAFERGVNFFDTADAYGPSISEELLGRALGDVTCAVYIATKVGLYRTPDAPREFKHDASKRRILEAVDGSLCRLKRDYIDLYQLHRPDPETPIELSMEAFAKLREVGKIRAIGLSEVGITEIERARSVAPIASVQNLFNVLDRGHQRVLDYCEQNGIAFIAWSPLGRGKLTGPREPIGRMATRLGRSAAQICLAWLLQHSPNLLPIPGSQRIDWLDENLASLSVKLDTRDLALLDSICSSAAMQRLKHSPLKPASS